MATEAAPAGKEDETSLGEQVAARWTRFIQMLKTWAAGTPLLARIANYEGLGSVAVIMIMRRHIAPHAALVYERSPRLFSKLPPELDWIEELYNAMPQDLQTKCWLYLELLMELCRE